jgi:uncharacterized repeat protein (TIGR01451 family)
LRHCCEYLAVLLLGLALRGGAALAQPGGSPADKPVVQIQTTGPATINLGEPFTYEVTVRNTGTRPVFQVRVVDDVPAGARYIGAEPRPQIQNGRLVWDLGSLDAGAERRLKVQVQPTGEGKLSSSATVTYSLSHTGSMEADVTRPRLTVRKTGPESVHVGDPAVFQIQVSNTGTGPATHVVVRDRLPPGLQHPQGSVIEGDLGTLAPGESKTLTLTTTAVHVGRQENEATVTGDGGLQAAAQVTVDVVQSQLQLRKSGPQNRFLGREAEFDLEVANPGTAPATSVRVIDTLPEGLDFVAASDGGAYEPTTRQVTWMLGTLAPGHRRGLTVKALARSSGDWVNRAVAQADRGLEQKAEATLHVEGVPALMLEVVDLEDPVEVGAETTYEIRVVNQGTSPCTNLVIEATLPPEMEARSAAGPADHRFQGQQVLYEPLPKLAARADALYRVKVRGLRDGDVRFKVRMSCDQLTAPVFEEESTRIYSD